MESKPNRILSTHLIESNLSLERLDEITKTGSFKVKNNKGGPVYEVGYHPKHGYTIYISYQLLAKFFREGNELQVVFDIKNIFEDFLTALESPSGEKPDPNEEMAKDLLTLHPMPEFDKKQILKEVLGKARRGDYSGDNQP